jgi:hypothetical protein
MKSASFFVFTRCAQRGFCFVETRWICLTAICLFAFAGHGIAQSQNVHPIDWSKYAGMTGVQPGDAFGRNITTVLQNQSRSLFKWIETTYPKAKLNGVQAYTFTDGAEHSVRPLAHFAIGNAIMIKTGTYDPAITGLSRNDALDRTQWAIRSVAMTHRSNNSNSSTQWGQGSKRIKSWQAAYWASRGAQAAWMLWDEIGSETKQAVAKMVKHEADAFIDYKVPYWKAPDGSTSDEGDTKAEENAWNSRVLTIAQAMMPNDPNVNRWRAKASELMVSSYCRQSDLNNPTLVDGKPVKQWINGYNTFDDGVLVNHDIAHPGYMSCHNLTYETMIDASLAGQFIPQSAFFNEQATWDAMTKVNFTAGTTPYGPKTTILPPGGTILRKKADGTPDPVPYFPNGDDWSRDLTTDVNFVLLCTYAKVRGLDAGQSVPAATWASVELDALRALQTRPGHDGNIYQSGDWRNDPERNDIDAYRELSEAWIIHWLAQHDQISPISDHWGAVPAGSRDSLSIGVPKTRKASGSTSEPPVASPSR